MGCPISAVSSGLLGCAIGGVVEKRTERKFLTEGHEPLLVGPAVIVVSERRTHDVAADALFIFDNKSTLGMPGEIGSDPHFTHYPLVSV